MNTSTEQTKQSTLTTDEQDINLLKYAIDEAYRRGYNIACDTLSESIMEHSADIGDPKIKMVVENLAILIKGCQLKEEEDVTLNG